MEDLLILILQALGQIIFEFFAYWPWGLVLVFDAIRYARDRGSDGTAYAILFSIGLGAMLGWLSLYIFPDVLVKWGWLRIVLLVVSPIGSGLISREMARVASGKKRFHRTGHALLDRPLFLHRARLGSLRLRAPAGLLSLENDKIRSTLIRQ